MLFCLKHIRTMKRRLLYVRGKKGVAMIFPQYIWPTSQTQPSHPIPFPSNSLVPARTKHSSAPRTKVPTYPEQTTTTKKEWKKEKQSPLSHHPHCPKPTNPPNPLHSKNPLPTPPILFPSLPPPSLPRAQVKVTWLPARLLTWLAPKPNQDTDAQLSSARHSHWKLTYQKKIGLATSNHQ